MEQTSIDHKGLDEAINREVTAFQILLSCI